MIQLDHGEDNLIMLDVSASPDLKNFPMVKEKEEKLRTIVDTAEGKKCKVTKLDLDKFKGVASKVGTLPDLVMKFYRKFMLRLFFRFLNG